MVLPYLIARDAERLLTFCTSSLANLQAQSIKARHDSVGKGRGRKSVVDDSLWRAGGLWAISRIDFHNRGASVIKSLQGPMLRANIME